MAVMWHAYTCSSLHACACSHLLHLYTLHHHTSLSTLPTLPINNVFGGGGVAKWRQAA